MLVADDPLVTFAVPKLPDERDQVHVADDVQEIVSLAVKVPMSDSASGAPAVVPPSGLNATSEVP